MTVEASSLVQDGTLEALVKHGEAAPFSERAIDSNAHIGFVGHNEGQIFAGQVKLVTMGQDSVHSCVELACNEEDQVIEKIPMTSKSFKV